MGALPKDNRAPSKDEVLWEDKWTEGSVQNST